MKTHKRSFRAIVAALAAAFLIGGLSASALADDVLFPAAPVVGPICSVEIVPNPVAGGGLVWDSVNFKWIPAPGSTTDTVGSLLYVKIDGVTAKITHTGEPQNRYCDITASNSDFKDGSKFLLPSTALHAKYLGNYYQFNLVLSQTYTEVGIPNTQENGDLWIEISGINHHTTPAGNYKSTLTFSIVSSL